MALPHETSAQIQPETLPSDISIPFIRLIERVLDDKIASLNLIHDKTSVSLQSIQPSTGPGEPHRIYFSDTMTDWDYHAYLVDQMGQPTGIVQIIVKDQQVVIELNGKLNLRHHTLLFCNHNRYFHLEFNRILK